MMRKIIIQPIFCIQLTPESFTKDSLCTLRLPHPYVIIIHKNAQIGNNCTIYHEVTIGCIETKSFDALLLKNNVYIGAKSCLLGKVLISEYTKIGACALILKSTVPNVTILGVYK